MLIVVVVVGLSLPAQAAILTVTKLADTNDGVCNADCSLREAIAAASAVNTDTIVFAAGVTGMIALTSQLAVNKSIIVDGPGSSLLTLLGSGSSRIFEVTGDNFTLSMPASPRRSTTRSPTAC